MFPQYMLVIIPYCVNKYFSNTIVLIMGHNKKLIDSEELYLFEFSNKKLKSSMHRTQTWK